MAEFHFTNCTNSECGIESKKLEVDADCPHCNEGKRQRDPQVPSLIVKRQENDEVVSITPVTNPYATRRGVEKYENIMMGMMRNMDMDRFYIDDSEFDK